MHACKTSVYNQQRCVNSNKWLRGEFPSSEKIPNIIFSFFAVPPPHNYILDHSKQLFFYNFSLNASFQRVSKLGCYPILLSIWKYWQLTQFYPFLTPIYPYPNPTPLLPNRSFYLVRGIKGFPPHIIHTRTQNKVFSSDFAGLARNQHHSLFSPQVPVSTYLQSVRKM